jgi:ferric-dicitrate binding protein FerR (iron transport regulator)
MRQQVTRDVVSDLWPLVQAGEASSDSRALVEAYLAEDSALAEKLRCSETLSEVMPGIRLSPDAERRLLDEARQRARLKLLLIGGGIALAGLLAMAAFVGIFFLASGVF